MRPLWVLLAVAALLGGRLALPGLARGQVLALPNARAVPGELGFLMGGALTALASGGEALWFNPAGLALETGTRLTAGGDLLRLQEVTGGGPADTALDTALGSVAYAQALGQRRGYPRFTLGLALALTADQRLPSRIARTRTGTAASLPPGFSAPGGSVDANFPSGLTLRDQGEALGELRVLAPGVGLGIAPADWLRVGAALQLERVSLAQRLSAATTYTGADGANTLAGQSQLAWVLAGEALRLAASLGVQLELTRSWVLGIALVLPGDTLQGAGRIAYQRSDAFTVDTGTPTSAGGTVLIARDALPFRLEAPQRLQVGLAYRSDRVLMELDLYRLAAQPPYVVLPGTESQPPSTLAVALPALETSGTAVLGGAVGVAYAQTARTSLLLALAADPSPVPPDDPLFRSVGVMTVTAGVYHVRGDLSASIGIVYREARQRGVASVPPDGGQPVLADASLREVAAQVGGSLVF
jgi:hypothetical protein